MAQWYNYNPNYIVVIPVYLAGLKLQFKLKNNLTKKFELGKA